ncbi:MAG: protein kinase [Hyphomicrobiaceae bacterium]|nr:protein kinase [Hyphomicrobiaceae bacterium]
MADVASLPPGTILIDEYEILRVLGAGGFGITYLAHHRGLDSKVAIKEYFPRGWSDRDATGTVGSKSDSDQPQFEWGLKRFLEEAQRLAKFNHPNIVRVERYFSANGTAYMVLGYEEGMTLKAWLEELPSPPNQDELDMILGPLLDAMELLHANGVFHRDLSPDNIFLRGSDGTPVLLDFGASREEIGRRHSQLIGAQSQMFTAIIKPGFSPIEQYDTRATRQGPWTDIYALGGVLYRAIMGSAPPEAPSRFTQDDYVPLHEAAKDGYRRSFLAAIDWSLRLLPEARPKSVSEWRKSLIGNADVPTEPPPVTRQPFVGPETGGRPTEATGGRKSSNAGGIALVLVPLMMMLGGTWLYLNPTLFPIKDEGPSKPGVRKDTPFTGKSASRRQIEQAESNYRQLILSRADRLRAARGLHHLGFQPDAELDMKFVDTGNIQGPTLDSFKRFQSSRGHLVTGYPDQSQISYLSTNGERMTAWELEQDILVLRQHKDDAWARIRALLEETGDLAGGGSSIGQVREALKKYQRRIGEPETGYLTTPLLQKIIETPIKLRPTQRDGAQRFSDWFHELRGDRCYVWTNVERIDGRSLVRDAPVVQFSKQRGSEGERMSFELARSRLFDTGSPVSLSGGSARYSLTIDGPVIKPRKIKNAVSEEVTRLFNSYKGMASITGSSAFGGPLTLNFSTTGFSEAFERMATVCGTGIRVWVSPSAPTPPSAPPSTPPVAFQPHAAVYRAGASFYAVWNHRTPTAADDTARQNCEKGERAKPSPGSCQRVAKFEKPVCFSLARTRGSDWGAAWEDSVATARSKSMAECVKSGMSCYIDLTFCADGSNFFRAKRK